jgi:hypothetical protein
MLLGQAVACVPPAKGRAELVRARNKDGGPVGGGSGGAGSDGAGSGGAGSDGAGSDGAGSDGAGSRVPTEPVAAHIPRYCVVPEHYPKTGLYSAGPRR